MTTPFVVRCGRDLKPVTFTFEARTEAQFDAVRKIVERDDFGHACHSYNIFAEEIGEYKGEFLFLFYTKDGKLNGHQIQPDGHVSFEYRSDVGDDE